MVNKKRPPLRPQGPSPTAAASQPTSVQIASTSSPPSLASDLDFPPMTGLPLAAKPPIGLGSSPACSPQLVEPTNATSSSQLPAKSAAESRDLSAKLHLSPVSSSLIQNLAPLVSPVPDLTISETTPLVTHPAIVNSTSAHNPSSESVVQPLPVNTHSSLAPDTSPSTFLWAARLKSSIRNLRKCADPDFLEDGTPVVVAPDSVILESSEIWKDHLIAHFTTTPPPTDKIYADLNPIWGKFGNISVRKFTSESCLVLIPSETTRAWVQDVGYWQAGNCSFTVSKWTPSANLHPQKLTSIPIWATLRNIPPQLYSLAGISIIASALGEPMHTEKSRLNHIQVGEAKVKVEILLDKPLPPTIVVRDSKGNSIKIDVDYPRRPPRCTGCSNFGHSIVYCPVSKNLKTKESFKKKMVVVDPSVSKVPKAVTILSEVTLPEKIVDQSMPRSPAVLPPSSPDVLYKDQTQLELESSRESSDSITSSQFDDIEEVLSSAHKSLSLPSIKNHLQNYKNLSPKAKKRARKQQRQAYREADNLAAKVLRLKESTSSG